MDNKTMELPKRRGRRPKKIINNNEKPWKTNNNGDDNKADGAIILRLKLDPAKIAAVKKSTSMTKNTDNLSDEDISEGMFHNDIPNDAICRKCLKHEKTIETLRIKLDRYETKEKTNNATKFHTNKLNFVMLNDNKNVILQKTNIKCWWDACNFDTIACSLPEFYHNSTYHILGCFCSFNCALAYNLYHLKDSKIYQRKSLTYKLYREIYDIDPDEQIDIKEAPPRELLQDFGGDMATDRFRASFATINKTYSIYIPPLKPINMIIEERNVENNDIDTDRKYVLKRENPLNKKKSVITSMNNYDNK